MVITFTPEQEARLAEAAHDGGLSPETFVAEAVLQALAYDQQEHAMLRERRERVNRGIFVEQDEMDRRFQRMMQAR